MVPPKRSLNVHVPWHELAGVLGLPLASQALPIETRCPVCLGDRLSIYQDSTSGGDWHYCFDCGQSGDMIELAAAAWSVTIPEAVTRLAHEGIHIPTESLTESEISGYIEAFPQQRKRLGRLWEIAQKYLTNGRSPIVRKLRTKLVLTDGLTRERQRSGPAKVFGAAKRVDVEKAFHPNKQSVGGKTRFFRGGGWSDVLLIPYFQAPDCLAGFCIVGRNGNRDDRFMLTIPRSGPQAYKREAGLAGLQLLDEHQTNYVIAMSDPVLMARLQVRNFNTSLRPLPLVCWYDGRQGRTTCWSSLNGRRLIFWSMYPNAELIKQCVETDGMLAIIGPQSRRQLGHWLRKNPPLDLVQRIHREAKPWQEAIADWMRKAPSSKVAGLLNRLDPELKDKLREAVPNHPLLEPGIQIRQAEVEERTIIERGGKWYYVDKQGKHRVYLNGIVRINTLVARKSDPEWIGELLMPRHDPIPFRVTRSEVHIACRRPRLSLGPWLKNLADEYGLDLKLPRGLYLPDLTNVACAFHEPRTVKGLDQVGWDGQSFVFRHMRIKGGAVKQLHDAALPAGCPGPLAKVARLSPVDHEPLSGSTAQHEGFWAVLTGLLASILAPPAAQEPLGTLITGDHALTPGKTILGRLGVPEQQICRLPRRPGELSPFAWDHGWPMLVKRHSSVRIDKLQAWLLDHPPETISFIGDAHVVYGLLLHGGFTVVDLGKLHIGAKVLAGLPVDRLLLAYLRNVSQRAFRLEPKETWWQTIRDDLASWLEEQGIDATAVRACDRWICEEHDGPRRLVTSLFHGGYLRFDASPARQWTRAVPVPFDGEGAIVTRSQLRQACASARLLIPDLDVFPDEMRITNADITASRPSP